MGRRPAWWKKVDAARDEALIAVAFYNRPGSGRRLETFLVHMHMAWLYLLQAEFDRTGVSYFYPDPNRPSRYQLVDGQRKTWELDRCIRHRWPDDRNPVRKNLELTVRLRNRIEHRYDDGLMVASAGFAQALLINFEEELVERIDAVASIADVVHLPISLSTFSREGVARLVAAQQSLPSKLKDFFIDYRAAMGDEAASDSRFEFRIDLIQKRAPSTEADLAVTFVREESLSADGLAAYEAHGKTGRVVLREKARPVANLGLMRPKAVSALVQEATPFRFRPSAEFPQAWKHFAVRPRRDATGKAKIKCDGRYCVFDEAHNDYVYTAAFVELLIKECRTEEGFRAVVGRAPTSKADKP